MNSGLKNSTDKFDFQTPPEAIIPLLPFLRKEWKIWECAAGKGNLVKAFQGYGFDVVASDIIDGNDFLMYEPKHYDCIVTNPPYVLKEEFLHRAYMLEKPFAFLLPLTTFETRTRQDMFVKYGVEVIFFDKRIAFETPEGKIGDTSKSWFSTAWFTNGLKIGKELNFVKLQQIRKKLQQSMPI